ncbi:MAG: hypothetical protein Q4B42_00880, partial [Oscillospiraceae bacterium]|nr:hypothetical protein [Oscillospiraceae bacterium]
EAERRRIEEEARAYREAETRYARQRLEEEELARKEAEEAERRRIEEEARAYREAEVRYARQRLEEEELARKEVEKEAEAGPVPEDIIEDLEEPIRAEVILESERPREELTEVMDEDFARLREYSRSRDGMRQDASEEENVIRAQVVKRTIVRPHSVSKKRIKPPRRRHED